MRLRPANTAGWRGVRPAALALALTSGLACRPAFAGSAGDPPSLTAVRMGGDAGHARLVLEFDRPLDGAPELSREAPSRDALAFRSEVGAMARDGEGLGPIRHWWLATADADQLRLIVGMEGGARIVRRFALGPARAGGAWRYVVDVQADAPADPPTSPREASASSEPTPAILVPASTRHRRHPGPPSPARSRPAVVVIDPGHGGFDPGARGLDVAEKDVNLAEALALRDRLAAEGRYRVVLTRETDVFVPLDERVRIARRAGADLFISLHSDSAGADASPHGASVYTLSDHGVSRVNEVIGADGWTGPRSEPGVAPILLDLTQRDTLNRSALFAALLIERIGRDVDLLPRTHRDAGYFVLLAPDVPAVLLEMGFITSPLDQARLTDPGSRVRLAQAIAGAIDAYFAGATAREANGSWQVSSATRPP